MVERKIISDKGDYYHPGQKTLVTFGGCSLSKNVSNLNF